MDEAGRDALEQDIRRRTEQGDVTAATKLALEAYGPELLRFLLSVHGREEEAADVFSLVAEGVWRGLGAFNWECSLRTWAYAIARKASLRYRRDEGRRGKRQVPIEDVSALSAIEEKVRTQTLSYLRSEVKSRFAELRDGLPEEERALLFLRIDRKLAWNDLARAMHEDEAPLEGEDLKRASARLRQRFQALKGKLVEIGRREGLLRGDNE